MKIAEITADLARSLLDYDPESGDLTWKHRPNGPQKWNTRHAGKAAGSAQRTGYRQVMFQKGCNIVAHRLAWLIYYGEMPSGPVDHINGIRSDNRIENMRIAANGENSINKAMQRNNTSGFTGVVWNKKVSKWHARVTVRGRTHHAGFFDDPAEAFAARNAMAMQLHGEFAVTDYSDRKRFFHYRDAEPRG